MTTPVALTIAGSDSSGGAGIQADLKTFAALGVYGASVITALTAQNTQGVTGIHLVPPEFVTAQIDAVFGDLDVGAVKIGMVAQLATIEAIAAGLKRWSPKHVVLDPVMVATSGDRLLAADAVEALRDKTHSARHDHHAEPARGRSAARRAGRLQRGRHRAPGQAAAGDGLSRGADQGRPRRGRGEHRLSDRARRRIALSAPRDRDRKHPRHRMLAVVGHRRRACQGRRYANRRAQRQEPGSARRSPQPTAFTVGHGHGPIHHFHKFY